MLLTAIGKHNKKLFRYSVEIKEYIISNDRMVFPEFPEGTIIGKTIHLDTGELHFERYNHPFKIDHLKISDGFKKNFKVLINHPVADGKSVYKRGNKIETED